MKYLLYIVATSLFLWSVISAVRLEFANPDMTDTRLWITFWPYYLGYFTVILISYVLIAIAKEMK